MSRQISHEQPYLYLAVDPAFRGQQPIRRASTLLEIGSLPCPFQQPRIQVIGRFLLPRQNPQIQEWMIERCKHPLSKIPSNQAKHHFSKYGEVLIHNSGQYALRQRKCAKDRTRMRLCRSNERHRSRDNRKDGNHVPRCNILYPRAISQPLCTPTRKARRSKSESQTSVS